MFSYIAVPNSAFLTQTEDMDHTVILDLVGDKESMYMNLKRPAGISAGSLLTVTPIPSEAGAITVEEITGEALPHSDAGSKVTTIDLFRRGINSSLFEMLTFIILPLSFLLSLIALVVLLIIIRKKQKAGLPNSSRVKFFTYFSASVTFLLPAPLFLILFLTASGVGTGGSKSVRAPALPGSLGMAMDGDDHVTVSYTTTTKRGTTLQVVSAEDGRGLTNYLERNGLPKQVGNEEVLSGYVKKGMNFVITQTDVANLPDGERSYIHVQFPSENIFFPLGVNYRESKEKHRVEALVLKPITVAGFSTDLSTKEKTGEEKNKTLEYFSEGENYSTKVHFFDEAQNYNHDITMKVGKSSKLIFTEFITKLWILFGAFFLLFTLFISLVSFGVSKLPKVLRAIYVLLPFLLLSVIVVVIVFFIFTARHDPMFGM